MPVDNKGTSKDTPTQDDPALTPPPDDQELVQTDPDNPPASEEDETHEEELAHDADEPGEEEESSDLSDEDLDAIAELYSDRLLKSPKLTERLSKTVKSEVERQTAERERTREASTQVDSLIARGTTAAQTLYGIVEATRAELSKAAKGEDFSADVMDKDKFVGSMREFGGAIAADVARTFDQAVEEAWDDVFTNVLPAVTDEKVGEAQQLVATYQRMRADPRQSAQAEGFFFRSLLKFVAERGMEQGSAEAIAKMGKAKPLLEKIAGRNAVAAAKAKIESQKNPPPAPKSKPTDIGSALSLEAYDKAKIAGDFARAQAIVNEAARRGIQLA